MLTVGVHESLNQQRLAQGVDVVEDMFENVEKPKNGTEEDGERKSITDKFQEYIHEDNKSNIN